MLKFDNRRKRMATMSMKLGIDVGGTFTDLALFNSDTGEISLTKVSSVPDAPSQAFKNGIPKILEKVNLSEVSIATIVHGTTLATNALIQRRGSSVALLVTKGFRDILHIGRQVRPKMHNWFFHRPLPLIPRHLRYEVPERTLYTGEIEKEISCDALDEIISDLRKLKVSSIAVCFLHSYINPHNELQAEAILREKCPDIRVSVSSEILPEFREYERMSTTTINAYIQPLMEDYTSKVKGILDDMGISAPVHIMQSNGGVMTVEAAGAKSVHTILSGPAAGVLGAKRVAENSGFSNVITADMGGTSFDISLIFNGNFTTSKESEVNGLPIKVPMIDIETIGAGGGSIAWVDEGGALRVGPQSAGAYPGPVCYQKGGTAPTVTDANLVLGRLRPEWFLGGQMRLNKDLSYSCLYETLAAPLKLSVEELAEGIIRVVNASMVRGIRKVSVERGFDPRQFVLESFGGAGPLHAVELARQLKIKKVLVPPFPGLNSAMGLLIADMRYDFIRTYIRKMRNVQLQEINEYFILLEKEAIDTLRNDSSKTSSIEKVRSADMRYFGQGHELEMFLPNGELTELDIVRAKEDYNKMHKIRFGYSIPSYEVEFVNLRVAVIGKLSKPVQKPAEISDQTVPKEAKMTSQKVYQDGAWIETPIYDRHLLKPGNTLTGPCIIGQMDSTTILNRNDSAIIDNYGNIIISVGAESNGQS